MTLFLLDEQPIDRYPVYTVTMVLGLIYLLVRAFGRNGRAVPYERTAQRQHADRLNDQEHRSQTNDVRVDTVLRVTGHVDRIEHNRVRVELHSFTCGQGHIQGVTGTQVIPRRVDEPVCRIGVYSCCEGQYQAQQHFPYISFHVHIQHSNFKLQTSNLKPQTNCSTYILCGIRHEPSYYLRSDT